VAAVADLGVPEVTEGEEAARGAPVAEAPAEAGES